MDWTEAEMTYRRTVGLMYKSDRLELRYRLPELPSWMRTGAKYAQEEKSPILRKTEVAGVREPSVLR